MRIIKTETRKRISARDISYIERQKRRGGTVRNSRKLRRRKVMAAVCDEMK